MEEKKIDINCDYKSLFETRQYLNKTDIKRLFDVGDTKASSIIQSIKAVSDIAHIAGRVTVSDYNRWYNSLGHEEGRKES